MFKQLLMTAFLLPSLAQATVAYKTTDGQGNIYLSDTPPNTGQSVQVVQLPNQVEIAQPAVVAPYPTAPVLTQAAPAVDPAPYQSALDLFKAQAQLANLITERTQESNQLEKHYVKLQQQYATANEDYLQHQSVNQEDDALRRQRLNLMVLQIDKAKQKLNLVQQDLTEKKMLYDKLTAYLSPKPQVLPQQVTPAPVAVAQNTNSRLPLSPDEVKKLAQLFGN